MGAEAPKERLRRALPAQSLRGRLVRGAFWSMADAGISQGLGLAASLIVARMLGRVGFGVESPKMSDRPAGPELPA